MAVRAVVGSVGCRLIALQLVWSAPGFAQQPATELPSEAAASPANTAAVPAAPAAAPAPTSPQSRPDWNIGAGFFSGGDSGLLSGLSGIVSPTFAGALEHRVAQHTWLALTASGSYESRDAPLSSSGESPGRASIPIRSLSGALLLGLRHEIVHGVVDVSIFAGGFIGAQRVRHDRLRTGEFFNGYQYNTSNLRSFGLIGGITLERQLIDALALRLSLDLAKLSFSRSQTETIDSLGVGTPQNLSTRSLGVAIRPGLQLYFYF
jgi:hypothetical protein